PRVFNSDEGERQRNQIARRFGRSGKGTNHRLHQNRDRRRSKTDRARRIASRRRSAGASRKLRHLFTAKIAVIGTTTFNKDRSSSIWLGDGCLEVVRASV